jgi:hypothetical protein
MTSIPAQKRFDSDAGSSSFLPQSFRHERCSSCPSQVQHARYLQLVTNLYHLPNAELNESNAFVTALFRWLMFHNLNEGLLSSRL